MAWVLFFCLLSVVGTMAATGLILALPERLRMPLVSHLVSYATGTLLGAVCLGLLPEAQEKAPPSLVLPWFLAGLLTFFLMEKLVLWRHCHKPECDVHANPGLLLMVGDAVHNFMDGVIIAGAFLLAFPLGVITGLAVLAHEIPQELGDTAVLLDSGYSRGRALLLNLLSALTIFPGGFLAFYFFSHLEQTLPYIMAFGAASFLYIALADLIPALHRRLGLKHTLIQLALILAGIGTIRLLHFHPH
jgi:zinc and cadmium transporter